MKDWQVAHQWSRFETFGGVYEATPLQCQQPPHSLTCHLDYGILIIRQASLLPISLNQNLRDSLVLKLKFSRFSKTLDAIVILIIFSRWVYSSPHASFTHGDIVHVNGIICYFCSYCKMLWRWIAYMALHLFSIHKS